MSAVKQKPGIWVLGGSTWTLLTCPVTSAVLVRGAQTLTGTFFVNCNLGQGLSFVNSEIGVITPCSEGSCEASISEWSCMILAGTGFYGTGSVLFTRLRPAQAEGAWPGHTVPRTPLQTTEAESP